jgi:hypothetical protein
VAVGAIIPVAVAAAVAIIPVAVAAAAAITRAIVAAVATIPESATHVPIITQVVLGTGRLGKGGTLAIIINGPSSKAGSGLASLKQARALIRISSRRMDAIVTPGSSYAFEWRMWHFMTHRFSSSTAESKTSEFSHG